MTDTAYSPFCPPALFGLRRALATSNHRRVPLLAIGSSTTAGRDASGYEYGWAFQLGRILRGGNRNASLWSGAGWYPARVTVDGTKWNGGGGQVTAAPEGLGFLSLRLAAGAWIERRVGPCDGIEVLHAAGTANGRYRVVVDGQVVATINPSSPPGVGVSHAEWSGWRSLGHRGPKLVRIQAVDPVTISGVRTTDGDPWRGVEVYGVGFSGNSSEHYTRRSPVGEAAVRSHNRAISVLNPAAMLVMIGANDLTVARPKAQYKANVREQLELAWAGCPDMAAVGVHSYPKQDVPVELQRNHWPLFAEAWCELVDEYPLVEVCDLSAIYPVSQQYDRDELLSADSAHSTDAGHALIAQAVADFVDRPIGPPSVPTTLTMPSADGPAPAELPGLVATFRAWDTTTPDGARVRSWAPGGGARTAVFEVPDGARGPVAREHGPGDRRWLEFDVQGDASLQCLMQTGSWSETYTGPLTIFAVWCLYPRSEPTRQGNPFSGRPGRYVYAGAYGDNTLRVGAGGSDGAAVAEPYHGHGSWQAVAIRYDGQNSGLWSSAYPTQKFALQHEGAYGLCGLTLSGSSDGRGSSTAMGVQVFTVIDGAVDDDTIAAVIRRLARDHALDGYGRTQV